MFSLLLFSGSNQTPKSVLSPYVIFKQYSLNTVNVDSVVRRALPSLCVQLRHALSPHCAAEVLVNTGANNTTPAPTSGT